MEDNKQNNNTGLFFLCILVLSISYYQLVWKPYFDKDQTKTSVQTTGIQDNVGTNDSKINSTNLEQNVSNSEGLVNDNVSNKLIQNQENFVSNSICSSPYIVETDKIIFNFCKKGARLKSVLLKDYKETIDKDSDYVDLIDFKEKINLPLEVYLNGYSDNDLEYEIRDLDGIFGKDNKFYFSKQDSVKIEFYAKAKNSWIIKKVFEIKRDNYFVDFYLEIDDSLSLEKIKNEDKLSLGWMKFIDKNNLGLSDKYSPPGFVWFDGQIANRVSYADFNGDSEKLKNGVEAKWVSLGNTYFMALFSSKNTSGTAYIENNPDLNLYTMKLGVPISSSLENKNSVNKVFSFLMYFGPKDYRILKEAGNDFQLNINLGKTAIISSTLLLMLRFLNNILGNYGVSIVLLTILVKALLFPINITAFRQMKSMQDIQPELQKIKEKVTDKSQMQMEIMQLYKKKNVNPFGGCFPILVQIPIFIGLYSALSLAVELRHAPFAFWINDLSSKEQLMIGGYPFPFLVILLVVSMLLQQWFTPSSGDPSQKKVMMVVTVFMGGLIFANMPAGLTLYFLTSNILSIAQQKYMQSKGVKESIIATSLASLFLFIFAFGISRFASIG